MSLRHQLAVTTLVAGFAAATAAPAQAEPPSTFGSHVRDCVATMQFTGTHNPGVMHRGAAGWEGQECE